MHQISSERPFVNSNTVSVNSWCCLFERLTTLDIELDNHKKMSAKISIYILFFFCLACKNPKSGPAENQHRDTITSTEQLNVDDKSPTAIKQEKKRYVVESKVDIYDPYDFALQIDTLKSILGKEMTIEIDYSEGESMEDRSAFVKITCKDTEIKFYENREGIHFSNITTPKLSVLNGVKIGTPKQAFLNNMNIKDPNVLSASIVVFTDDYGAMEFYFDKDILTLMKIYYEEGD